jgi:hypothetical protein
MPTLLAVVLFVSPCKLVSPAQASAALGAKVGKPTVQTLGNFRSCSYAAGSAFLTVQTRALSKADFVESAKQNPPPVKPVSVGGGTVAYSASGFTVLVWRNGTEATFTIVHGGGVPAEIALAKTVAARI